MYFHWIDISRSIAVFLQYFKDFVLSFTRFFFYIQEICYYLYLYFTISNMTLIFWPFLGFSFYDWIWGIWLWLAVIFNNSFALILFHLLNVLIYITFLKFGTYSDIISCIFSHFCLLHGFQLLHSVLEVILWLTDVLSFLKICVLYCTISIATPSNSLLF